MMKNLKILIANDDGIRSEGIAHLARAAAQFGSVWVAAPERQCSGMSVRLTISETSEMAVYRYDFPAPVEAAWSVDGTPADCVKVALRALLPEREEGYITLSCTTAGGSGVLRAFYCDSVRVNGRDLGRRLVAVSPDIYGDSGFQGVWRMEEQEGAHELVQAALE